ncbi:MAG TPA: tetratricopeptide repeat protein, partial [bacterium]
DGLRDENPETEIEEKHVSIEDKVKLFDVIKSNPDFGAKRLSEELNTIKYGFTILDEKRIYDELVRSRLNTRELRVAFAERGGKGKRLKPPGTPFLTLDGQIILPTGLRRFLRPPAPYTEKEEEKPKIEIRASQKPKKEIEKDFLAIFGESKAEPGPAAQPEAVEPHLEEEFPSKTGEVEASERTEGPAVPESDLAADDWLGMLNEYGKTETTPVTAPGEAGSGYEATEDELADDGIEHSITSSIAGEIFDEELGKIETFLESDTKRNISTESLFEIIEESETSGRIPDSDGVSSEVLRRVRRRQFLESGTWFYRQGLFAKAADEFKKAVQSDPDSVEAFQHLGDAFFKLGQADKAIDAYQKVRRMDPDNMNVLENLGVIFANRGDYAKAVWQWGEVLKRNPARKDIIERIRRMQRFIRQRSL